LASERIERVRRLYELSRATWAAGEPAPDDVWEGFAEDIDYDPIPNYPEVRHVKGLAGLRAFTDDLVASFGGIDIEPTSFEEHGDAVIARIMIRTVGTPQRPATTGRVFAVFTFRGDEVVRWQDFLTAAEARRAAGAGE
jgi:hypothetical protein